MRTLGPPIGLRERAGRAVQRVLLDHLVIDGSIFPHSAIQKTTWISPGGRKKRGSSGLLVSFAAGFFGMSRNSVAWHPKKWLRRRLGVSENRVYLCFVLFLLHNFWEAERRFLWRRYCGKTYSAASREFTTLWSLWWRVSLSIRVQITLKNIRFRQCL